MGWSLGAGAPEWSECGVMVRRGLVAWENSSSTGTKRIAVQALNGQGRGTGTVQVISQNVDRVNDTDPMIAQVDESTAVVVWSSGRRGNSDVYLAWWRATARVWARSSRSTSKRAGTRANPQ